MKPMPGRTWPAAACLAVLVASCASPESERPVIEPSPEASIEAAADVSADSPAEAGKDAEAGTEADVADAVSEVEAGADSCAPQVPYDAADGPCTKGTIEKQWCGACGRRQRFCGNDSQWKPWSDCLEDDLAVCDQCETREVSCGFCGKRVIACETGQDTCRWVLAACTQTGECAAGDYDTDPTGCPQGQVRVRRCNDSCAWGDAGSCESGPGWEPLPQAPLAARESMASVATGTRWFIWGGVGETGYLADGAIFHPSTNLWEPLPAPTWPAADGGSEGLSARADVAIAAIPNGVVIFGGVGEGAAILGDGAKWNASTGWSALSSSGAPSERRGATAVYDEASDSVFVWGGRGKYGGAASGGASYALSSNTWQPISAAPIGNREGHTALWDAVHSRIIVWGGAADSSSPPERSGAAYDPQTDTWTAIADAPIRRRNAFAFWDSASSRMVVLLGEDGEWPGPKGDGAAYDPSSDSWEMLPDLALTAYQPGWGEAAAWGDGRAWVTGGDVAWASGLTGMGARYDSARDAWGRVPALPEARSGHASVFQDTLLIWGGRGPTGLLASGVRVRESGLLP